MEKRTDIIWFLKVLSIFILAGIMFILNEHCEKSDGQNTNEHSSFIEIGIHKSGIPPLSVYVPGHTEDSLPLKLTKNPKSDIAILIRRNLGLLDDVIFKHIQNTYLNSCCNNLNIFLQVIIDTSKNKDIR